MRFWNDTEFKDERGAIIIHRSICDTDSDDSYREVFLGKGMVMLNTPMGEMPIEFEVPMDVDCIKEAFEEFEEQMNEKAPAIAEQEAHKVTEEIKEKMMDKSQSIITPDQIRNNSSFDPNIRG